MAVNQTTDDERTVVTDASGNYYVSFLLPGAYHVTVKAAGSTPLLSIRCRSLSPLSERRAREAGGRVKPSEPAKRATE